MELASLMSPALEGRVFTLAPPGKLELADKLSQILAAIPENLKFNRNTLEQENNVILGQDSERKFSSSCTMRTDPPPDKLERMCFPE